jgi:hypothetical protein
MTRKDRIVSGTKNQKKAASKKNKRIAREASSNRKKHIES